MPCFWSGLVNTVCTEITESLPPIGLTWVQKITGTGFNRILTATSTDILYLDHNGAIEKSSDYGGSWVVVKASFAAELLDVSFDGSHALSEDAGASYRQGFLYNGSSWTNITEAFTQTVFQNGVIFAGSNSTIIASFDNFGTKTLQRSTNSGGSWSDVTPASITSAIPKNCSNDGLKVVCEVDKGLFNDYFYLSVDSGLTYTEMAGVTLATSGVNVYVSGDGSAIFETYLKDIKKSTDNGATFSTLYTHVNNIAQFDISADGQVIIFRDSVTWWIFVSVDGGATFTQSDLQAQATLSLKSTGDKAAATSFNVGIYTNG